MLTSLNTLYALAGFATDEAMLSLAISLRSNLSDVSRTACLLFRPRRFASWIPIHPLPKHPARFEIGDGRVVGATQPMP